MRAVVVGALALAATASSQCVGSWQPGFAGPGPNSYITKLAAFDDGSGPALIVGGAFTAIGDQGLNRIAKWDGSAWSPLGSGLNGEVRAMCAFDDGTGPALYVSGYFSIAGGVAAPGMARWRGSSWFAVPAVPGSAPARALAVFDGGTGPALYAGGTFMPSGVARLTASGWVPLPGYPGLVTASVDVSALAACQIAGPRLFATGVYTTSVGFTGPYVGQWDGQTWAGAAINGNGYALAAFDAGAGPSVYVAGSFTGVSGFQANNIACVVGPSFGPLGSGLNAAASDLAVFDDGNGAALYAAGGFTLAGGAPALHIAKWNGSSWSALGSGLASNTNNVSPLLAAVGTGTGARMCAGSGIETAGGMPAANLASWNGASWSGMPGVNAGGFAAPPAGLATLDLGSGPALYAAGHLLTQSTAWDGVMTKGIAGWQPVGPSLPGIGLMGAYDMGGGLRLHAGAGTGFWRLDSGTWTSFGAPSASGGTLSFPGANAFCWYDDGVTQSLYVGGHFDAISGVLCSNIARWDGVAWHAVGGGVAGTPIGFVWPRVTSLVVYDDGGGPALFAAGYFSSAGGIPAAGIAKWNGAGWSGVGTGLSGSGGLQWVSLAVYDDGAGPRLYAAAANLVSAGGVGVTGLARWNGQAWSAVAPPPGVSAFGPGFLAVLDDGSGPALHCVQNATVYRLHGSSSWDQLPGMSHILYNPSINTITAADDGSGPAIFAIGTFDMAGTERAGSIAKWAAPTPTIMLAQSGLGGAGITIADHHLLPSHAYANVFSTMPCGAIGAGPYLGLCSSDPGVLISQLLLPAGTPPFRFVASAPSMSFGPYTGVPGITVDAIVLDFAGSALGCRSQVARLVIQ